MRSSLVLAFALFCSVALVYGADRCGYRPLVTNYSIDDKVVGGQVAVPGDWPWQITLFRNGQFICGGSLINDEWIITAAHCVTGSSNPAAYRVMLGAHDRSIPESWVLNRDVVKVYYHENYDANYIRNDVAVLQLAQKVPISDYIMPICAPDRGETFEGASSVTTGWGATFYGGAASRYLLQVATPVLTDSACRSRYQTGLVDTNTQVCSGGNNQGACQGDSGGPLAVISKNDQKKYTLVGLTSWGINCGQGGVYTRVSAFLDWIENKVGSKLPQ